MQRRTRILVAALVALAGGALAFAGTAPKALATVSEAAGGPVGEEVTLRGTLKEGSLDRASSPIRFLVTDGARDLAVTWDRELPEHEAGGSLEGRLIVVTGVLEAGPSLRATDLQVGCASKYEAT